MGTTRFFSGARSSSKMGEAARLKRWEIIKGGPLAMSPTERYRHMMKKKLQEYQQKSQAQRMGVAGQELSVRARKALEEIAKRKTIKEEKAMRQMVVIKPRRYGDFGHIDKRGCVYDQQNNLVLKVNRKNGVISTMGGMRIGKYRPRNMSHAGFMQGAIVKFSPYHIKLRQMIAQQSVQNMYAVHGYGAPAAVYGPEGDETAINVYGRLGGHRGGQHFDDEEEIAPVYGRPKRNNGSATVNGWGVMANNVHGVYAEDTWGNFRDNVWGGTSSNIWGGLGDDGGLWGGGGIWGRSKHKHVWGKGDHHALHAAHHEHIWGQPGRRIFGSGRPGQANLLAKAMWAALGMTKLGARLALRIGSKSAAARIAAARAAAAGGHHEALGRSGGAAGGGRPMGRVGK